MPRVRLLANTLGAAALLLAAGCVFVSPDRAVTPPLAPAPKKDDATFDKVPEGKISSEQLGQMVQGFADRYYALVSSACDKLAKDARSPAERLFLDRFQSRTVSAVYDIATNPDPFSQLLDLTVVVTLTSMIAIDEAAADDLLGSGERAQILKSPLRQAREEVWEIAAKAMNAEQLETLDRLIVDWRRLNPDVESVSFIRFDDFATSRGKSVIADVRAGTGLLAPIDDVKKEANEARLFAERVFYMAKRAPLLVSLESGHLLSQVAATPEVIQAASLGDRFATSAERLTAVVEQLPKTVSDEREKIVDSIDQTSGSLRSTLKDYESAVERTDELVKRVNELSVSAREVLASVDGAASTLTETLDAAGRVATQLTPAPGAEPSKPVDPEVYARIAADLKGSLAEVNKALESTRTLAEGSLWQKPLQAAEKAADERITQASRELRSLSDVVFWRAVGLIAVTFLLLFIYTAWSVQLRTRAQRKMLP